MPSRTEVIMIRHGETEWNRIGRLQGQLDSPLTHRGREQARSLRTALAARPIDAVYASDLGRVRATCAECFGPERAVTWTPALRERGFGCFEGLSWTEIGERWPDILQRRRAGDPHATAPDGETVAAVQARVWTVLDAAVAAHRGGRIAIVSHGGVLGTVFRDVLGLDPGAPRRFEVPNGAYNEFAVDDDEWRLVTWGGFGHLAAVDVEADRAAPEIGEV